MPTPHPVWNAIKRGMFLGGLVGLNLAFLAISDGYIVDASAFTYMFNGAASGLFAGAVLGLVWRRVQGPLSRLEADLKAAAALRDKGLIDEVDFRSLKTRILAAYSPDPSGARAVLAMMAWMGLIGITIALGMMLDDYNAWPYSTMGLILPLTAFGIAVGAAAAAIIQTALERGGASASKTSTPS